MAHNLRAKDILILLLGICCSRTYADVIFMIILYSRIVQNHSTLKWSWR